MAKFLEAIREYGPRLKLQSFLRLDEIARWIGRRTTISPNLVVMVAREFSEAIKYYNAQGIPVKMDGLGTFTPSIDRHGNIKINFRADPALKKGLTLDTFSGDIENKRHIGLDDQGYKAVWDAAHPDNPLEV